MRRECFRFVGAVILSTLIAFPLSANAQGWPRLFNTRLDYPIQAPPTSLMTGDLNGDSLVDIVVTSFTDSSLSIFMRNPDGTLGQPAITTQYGSVVEFGDVDGDGDLDMVGIRTGYTEYAVYKNNGSGQFGAPAYFAMGPNTQKFALGDIDGDSDLDIVALQTSSIGVLKNNGNGTFAAVVNHTFPNVNNGTITVQDFDGDGDCDVATYDTYTVYYSESVAGVPQTPSSFGQSSSNPYLATGDLDGDGDLDMVFVGSNSVDLVYNQGNGVFSAPINRWLSGTVDLSSACLVDLDGDSDYDLVVSESSSGGSANRGVHAFYNNGAGTFSNGVYYQIGEGGHEAAIRDLDNDSSPDIIVLNRTQMSFSVLINNGQGGFSKPNLASLLGSYPVSVTAGDLNGDQKPDLVAVRDYGLDLLQGVGDGSFVQMSPGKSGSVAALIEDLDDDGDQEIVTRNVGTTIYRNNGDGTFMSAFSLGGGYVYDFAAADFDGDTDIDLVSGTDGAVLVSKKNIGNPYYDLPISIPVATGMYLVATADIDGDTDVDIVAGRLYSGAAYILFNDGNGAFGTPVPLTVYSLSTMAMVCADLDHDSDIDLAFYGRTPNTVAVLKNNGNGTFAAPNIYAISWSIPEFVGYFPEGSHNLQACDLDRDSDIDLAIAEEHGNNITVLLNTGHGSFKVGPGYGIGMNPRGLAIADFNGDGAMDLATANSYSLGTNYVSTLLNLSPPSTSVPALTWKSQQ